MWIGGSSAGSTRCDPTPAVEVAESPLVADGIARTLHTAGDTARPEITGPGFSGQRRRVLVIEDEDTCVALARPRPCGSGATSCPPRRVLLDAD